MLATEIVPVIMLTMISIAPFRLATTLGVSALLFACGSGGGGGGGGGDAGNPNGPDAAGGGDGDGGVNQPDADLSGLVWTPLITGDWSLPAGGEDPSDDHSIVLDRDIYVGAIRPIDPVGTHHTLLDNGGAGVIYASGVGTNEVIFPPGVGLKLTAGTTLNLQLHVFNPGGSPISGTSGVEIVEVAEADVTDIADIFLPGPFDFVLAPMQQTVHSGSCTVTQAQTLFALFPHMHQLGTHFKMSVTKGGTEQMVHDKPYDFNEQTFSKFDPIELSPGDSVNTECTWVNTGSQGVFWGDGSNQEMCFSILYRYPALSDGEFCDDGFTP